MYVLIKNCYDEGGDFIVASAKNKRELLDVRRKLLDQITGKYRILEETTHCIKIAPIKGSEFSYIIKKVED